MNNELYIHLSGEQNLPQPELILGPLELVVIRGALHLFDGGSEHGYFSEDIIPGENGFVRFGHRLFMRYKTGGDAQAQLLSNSGGQPQVTVAFEVGGK